MLSRDAFGNTMKCEVKFETGSWREFLESSKLLRLTLHCILKVKKFLSVKRCYKLHISYREDMF